LAQTAAPTAPGYPLAPVPFNQVTLADDFWRPRLETQRQTLVPYSFSQTHEALTDLQAAAELLAGRTPDPMPPPHRYRTSDLFKVMEGAAYLLASRRDPALEQQMDAIVDVIAGAQEPDGYLNATRTLYPHREIDMMGDGLYTYEDHSHELYIVGHLYEAAVAYARATGKTKLLDVAEKNAQHVRRAFFDGGDQKYNDGKPVNQAPGHQEIELALVKLAEATGKREYLETAEKFLDIRGVTHRPEGEGVFAPTYAQQHAAVVDQTEPVGHAVRATYLYSGMADVGAMLASDKYTPALDKIWTNIVDTRMHITGGLGAVHGIEGFGPEFELPNADAFDETCAAVGNVFFNWRMFLLHRDAKYVDVAEIALYNNVLAGMNFAGDRFFYVNPLAADGFRPFNHGHAERAPWFGTACCPTNLARLVPQVAGMLFAVDDAGLSLCLYASCESKVTLGGIEVALKETTRYPFDGRVELEIDPETPSQFAVRLRIPTWTGDRLVPGELYRFAGDAAPHVQVSVNGAPQELEIQHGFAVIDREWCRDDRVTLELPMPVRASECRPEVEANRGRLALSRGPLLYCAESADNPGHAYNYMLPRDAATGYNATTREIEIAGQRVTAIQVSALRLAGAAEPEPAPLTLVPYYAWNNRGVGSMSMWLPDNPETLRAGAFVVDDNAKRFQSATASHTFDQDRVDAMIDGRLPKHSFDMTIPRWTSWPQRGEPQTLEFALAGPTKVRTIEVYWYDDHGGVQVPERWELEVPGEGDAEGDAWQPFALYNTDSYGVSPDQFNVVHPAEPLTIERLRLHVWPQRDAAAGILELVVQPETQ
jgi:DUF1680 family protein